MKEINIFKKIQKILELTKSTHKNRLFIIFLIVIFSSTLEVFSVYLVIPLYKVVIEKNSINETIPWLNSIFKLSFDNFKQEQFVLLSFFAIIFLLSNVSKMFLLWQAGKQTGKIGSYLFSLGYSKLLSKPYEYIARENLSRYSSNFLTTNTYFVAVLKNIVLLVGYFTTSLILLFSLVILNPSATIFSLIFLTTPYLIILKLTKPALYKLSKQISYQHEDINRYTQEAFNSLKTIKHFQIQKYYTDIFYKQESKLREKIALTELIETYPKFLLEGLGLTMLVILYGSSILIEGINIENVFLITLIFSCQKLLPTLQQIYRIIAYLITHSSAVSDLYNYLYGNQIFENKFIYEKNTIKFNNVSYFYPKLFRNQGEENPEKLILNNINFEIKFPSSISITGDSGSGKTTFVDLLTGLLTPSKGFITLPKEFKKSGSIGYVPQEVPIINGTFIENLCLGNNELNKDMNYLLECIDIVDLKKTINKFP